MARILGSFGTIMASIQQGYSANATYRELQNQGIGARRSEVLALYKLAKGIVAGSPDEVFRDITAVPTASEITPWPTAKATGFAQTVTLVYRDRTTGSYAQTYYRVSNPQPVTRESVMATAASAYADTAEQYNQDLIGALHTSTYENIPFAQQAA